MIYGNEMNVKLYQISTVVVFQEKSGGGQEELRVLNKYLGMFVDYTCSS